MPALPHRSVRLTLAMLCLAGVGAATAQNRPPGQDAGAATGAAAASGSHIFEPPVRPYPDRRVDIRAVRVEAAFSPHNRALSGILVADIVATEADVLQFVWPTHGIAIDSVRVPAAAGDTTLSVVRGDSLVFSLPTALDRNRPTTVRIGFTATPGRGLEASTDPREGTGCCVWTSTRWLPVPDDPGDRFQADLQLRVPGGGWQLVGTAPVRRETAGEEAAVRIVPPRPVRVQDLGWAAGSLERTHVDDMVYHVAGAAEVRPFSEAIQSARTFLAQSLGYRLPWDTLHVVVGPFARTASFPGMLWLPESELLRKDADLLMTAASLVARQWTESILGPDWWTDAWIGPGLAGVMAIAYLEDRLGPDAGAEARWNHLQAYLAEAENRQRPLVWDRYYHPEDLRDAHALHKAPLILAHIRAQLDSAAFWAGLRRLLAASAFESLDAGALTEALDRDGSGMVARLFDAWVYAAGHPIVAVQTRFDNDAEEVIVRVSQQQEGPLTPAAFPLDTSAEWLLFEALSSQAFLVDDREAEVAIKMAIPPRFVALDPDGLLVAEFRPAWDLSAASAALRSGRLATRLRAARVLSSLGDDPAIGISLRMALGQETSPAVRTEILRSMASMPASASLLELLRQVLQDPEPRVREAAAATVGILYPDGEMDELLESVAQQDTLPSVQAAAVRAMSGSGAEGLARAALITPSEGDVIHNAGVAALMTSGAADQQDFLALTEPGLPPNRIATGLRLAESVATGRNLRMRVLNLMGHPSVAVRLAAAEAGYRLLLAGNAPAVRRLAENDWHADVAHALMTLAEDLGRE